MNSSSTERKRETGGGGGGERNEDKGIPKSDKNLCDISIFVLFARMVLIWVDGGCLRESVVMT